MKSVMYFNRQYEMFEYFKENTYMIYAFIHYHPVKCERISKPMTSNLLKNSIQFCSQIPFMASRLFQTYLSQETFSATRIHFLP